MSKANVLGRGLSALISDNPNPTLKTKTIEKAANSNLRQDVEIEKLAPGDVQPRRIFNDEKLQDLAQSIRKNGIIQPIIVAPKVDGIFKIIAGERRWRACKIAGLKIVPIEIKEVDNDQQLEMAIIENVQREELSPIEECDAYLRLINEKNYTQEQVALAVGKSRSYVANIIRLANLPEKIKDLVNEGKLSNGHAKALIGLEKKEAEFLAGEIVAKNLNVRQVEKIVKKAGEQNSRELPKNLVTKSAHKASSDLVEIIDNIASDIGLNFIITEKDHKGKITVEFNNLAELDKILEKFS